MPVDQNKIVMGDSVPIFNHETCDDVASELSLELQKKVRNFAVGGSCVSDDSPKCTGNFPTQYATAKAQVPNMNLVILDGGANDLQYECTDAELPDCASDVAKTVIDVKALLMQIKADGKQPVYLGLYNIINVDLKKFNLALAALKAEISTFCAAEGITYIDLTPLFTNNDYYFVDGVHPSNLGSETIADAVYAHLPVELKAAPKIGVWDKIKLTLNKAFGSTYVE
jgi:lysophospholipase L1-like esterase